MVATATPHIERATPAYAGIATRGIGLTIDAAIANGGLLLVAALLSLVTSLVGDLQPEWLVAVLAATGWLIGLIAYFSLFWTTTGQTPGMRLMELRVIDARGEPPHLVRAVVRVVFLGLAIIPLFAGFIPVFFDSRRRGIHDMAARTTVIHAPAMIPGP